jgi:predicted membrane protein
VTSNTPSGFRITPQAVFGLLIIVAGLLMTADNLQWFDASEVLRFWPIGIIVAGALKFAQSPSSSGRLFGAIIVFVGMLFTAEHTLRWNVDAEDWWFPAMLIGIGVLVILRAQNPPAPKKVKVTFSDRTTGDSGGPGTVETGFSGFSTSTTTGSTDATVSEVAIWAGKQRKVTSAAFRRGDLTAVMGGIELDLRAAGTANGEAVIDLFVMWGGIEIWVPPDWSVSNEVGVLMAGSEDKSTGTQAARHRLVVRGFAIMGGVEIKT